MWCFSLPPFLNASLCQTAVTDTLGFYFTVLCGGGMRYRLITWHYKEVNYTSLTSLYVILDISEPIGATENCFPERDIWIWEHVEGSLQAKRRAARSTGSITATSQDPLWSVSDGLCKSGQINIDILLKIAVSHRLPIGFLQAVTWLNWTCNVFVLGLFWSEGPILAIWNHHWVKQNSVISSWGKNLSQRPK